jgi:hypothetical protein
MHAAAPKFIFIESKRRNADIFILSIDDVTPPCSGHPLFTGCVTGSRDKPRGSARCEHFNIKQVLVRRIDSDFILTFD